MTSTRPTDSRTDTARLSAPVDEDDRFLRI